MSYEEKYLKYKNKYLEAKAGASSQITRQNQDADEAAEYHDAQQDHDSFFTSSTGQQKRRKKKKISVMRSKVDRKLLIHDNPAHAKKCQKLIDLFETVIYNNRFLENVMIKMIREAPDYQRKDCIKNYPGWKTEKTLPRSIDEYFSTLLSIITTAPAWDAFTNPYNGLPLLRFLVNTLSTPSGFLFYGHIIVNEFFRSVLSLWKEYLDSKDSRYVLTKDGWLGMYSINEFKLDKNDKYYGFKSWNDFFIRKFKNMDKIRPVGTSLVVSPADFTIMNHMKDLDYQTEFLSVKGDTYSVQHILGGVNPKIKKKFAGGTLVQGFLDAEHYHRFHSPVDAKLVHAAVEDGSLYLMKNFSLLNGNEFCGQDHIIWSESFFSNIQTRGIFIFEHEKLGHIAMIVIGMIEVSSCILYDHLIGKKLKRGQEIGYFQYGGSSIILMFEKKVAPKLDFKIKTKNFNIDREELVKIRSNLADFKQ